MTKLTQILTNEEIAVIMTGDGELSTKTEIAIMNFFDGEGYDFNDGETDIYEVAFEALESEGFGESEEDFDVDFVDDPDFVDFYNSTRSGIQMF